MGLRSLTLKSRGVRRRIAPNGRKISTSSPMIKTGSGGGFLGKVMGLFSKLTGFLGQVFSKLGEIVMKGIGSALIWIKDTLEEIANFDFNKTDEELRDEIKSRNEALMGTFGGLAGRGLGSVVAVTIGVGTSLVVPIIGGRALATSLFESVSGEMLQEFWEETQSALGTIGETIKANTVAKLYMHGRQAIKRMPFDALSNLVGDEGAVFIKRSWGAAGSPSWTLVGWRDQKIEEIKKDGWRNFWEEFIDEGWDAFSEGLCLVSAELDDAANAQLLSRAQSLNGIELTPDREMPRETVKIYGSPTEITQQVHTVMATRQLLNNRDVGYIGALQEEGVWIPEHQRRRITLIWYSVKSPPWTTSSPDHKTSVRAIKKQVSIPNPRSSTGWHEVKAAMGGEGGYQSGAYYAVARMSSRRKMTVYGGSESDAMRMLEALAELSEDDIQNVSTGVRHRLGGKRIEVAKQSVQVYPAYAITARLRQSEKEEGRLLTEGYSYTEDRRKVELWRDKPPEDPSLFD